MNTINLDHHRPQSGECAPFYAGYIARVPQQRVFSFISTQINRLQDILSDVTEEQGNFSYAEGKWTIKQVLRHIADAERVFAYRMLCISRGEQGGLPGYDQDQYAVQTSVDHLTLADILSELVAARASTLAMIRNIEDQHWPRMGKASNTPVSVRALFYMIGGHMEHHIHLFEERYLPKLS